MQANMKDIVEGGTDKGINFDTTKQLAEVAGGVS